MAMDNRDGETGPPTYEGDSLKPVPSSFKGVSADGDKTLSTDTDHSESDYLYQQPDSEKNDQGGTGELVCCDEGYWAYKTDTDLEYFVRELYVKGDPLHPDTNILTPDRLKRRLLTESIPSILCLASVSGLPDCGKSLTLLAALAKSIGTSEHHDKHHLDEHIKARYKENGLSAYDINILSRHPYSDFTWALSSKRCGMTSCLLSYLVRCGALHDQLFSHKHIHDPHAEVFASPLLNKHFHWMLRDAEVNYHSLRLEETKQKFFRSGVCLVHIWDIGVNKAIYEFLGIIACHLRRSFHLAFFSLDRDAPHFNEPVDLSHCEKYTTRMDHMQLLRWRSRLHYLLRFATAGRWFTGKQRKVTQNTSMMVATSEEKSLDEDKLKKAKEAIFTAAKKHGVHHMIRPEILSATLGLLEEALEKQKEVLENAIYNHPRYSFQLPLKWIFLRSALAGEKSPKLFVSTEHVHKLADELEFLNGEFDEFLVTFTSFGSILYCPEFSPLNTHILTNIPKFCELLSNLYYPADHTGDIAKYGIVSKEEAIKILGEENAIHFMGVLVSLGMAAEVPKGCLEGCSQSDVSYFLPGARIGERVTKPQPNSVYIVVSTDHMPMGSQAALAHSILENVPEATLIASESFNATNFTTERAPFTLVFHSYAVELQTPTEVSQQLRSKLLQACIDAMTSHAKYTKGLQFGIALACFDEEKPNFHFLKGHGKHESCERCEASNSTDPLRQCWIKAAEECLQATGSYISEYLILEEDLTLSQMVSAAEQLARKFIREDKTEELIDRLGLSDEQQGLLSSFSGSDKIMMMLMLWKQSRKEEHPKLDKIIKDL